MKLVQHMKWAFDDDHHLFVFVCYMVVLWLDDLTLCFVSFILPAEGNLRDKEVQISQMSLAD